MTSVHRATFGRAAGAAKSSAESAGKSEAGPGVVVFRRSAWRMAFAWTFYTWPLMVVMGLALAYWLGSDPDAYAKGIIIFAVAGPFYVAVFLFLFRRYLFTSRSPLVLRPEGVQLSLIGSEKIHPWKNVRLLPVGPFWMIMCWVMVDNIGEDDLIRIGPLHYSFYRLVKRLLPKRASTSVVLQLPLIYSPGQAEVHRLFKEYKAAA